jgi:hypothetical protein
MKDKFIGFLIGAIILYWIFKWIKRHIPSPSDFIPKLPKLPNVITDITGDLPRLPAPITGFSDYMWLIIILIILFAVLRKLF